ncbi:MAG: metal-dependent hydrolase [Clostridia bacterium]|nr:metal-dependent hydrolase [Clostridia bacterium]
MQCRTHIAFGVAVSTAMVHTGDIKTILITIAGATIGSAIPDLDSYNSELSQILNKITGIIVATITICLAITYILKIDILDKIVQYKNVTNILIGILLFLFISILGSNTKHRTFMHSLLCVGIYYLILSIFLSQSFAVPFTVGMLSHILLDLLNHIGVGLFCPFTEKRFCLDLCASNGVVNKVLFYVSVVFICIIRAIA